MTNSDSSDFAEKNVAGFLCPLRLISLSTCLLLDASFGTACKNVENNRESADYIKCENDDDLNNDKDNFICYLPSHHLRRPS